MIIGFYFIKNLDETSVRGSNFYIIILGYLQDVGQSLDFLSKTSYKHINNNHKALRFNQIKDLQDIDSSFENLLNDDKDSLKSEINWKVIPFREKYFY